MLLTGVGARASAAWTPADLGSVVKLWLEGDSGTGGSNAGDAVSAWTDQSSNAANATQASAPNQPTYQPNVINGKPIVRFSGNHYLDFANKFSSLTEIQAFVVIKAAADPPSSSVGLWNFSPDNAASLYPFTDGTIYDSFGSTARKGTANPTPSLASFRLYSVTSKSGEWTNYVDGAQLYTTATNTVGMTTAPQLGISLGSYFFNGDIALFIICSPIIVGADLSNLKNFIGNKYSLTIS